MPSWLETGNNSDWQCGTPSSAPNGDHSRDGYLWGTDLGDKANTCQDAMLVSPIIDLSSYSGATVKLTFWHWHNFRECTCLCGLSPNESDSGGMIEVTAGGSWSVAIPDGGYDNGGYHVNCASSGNCNDAPCALDESTQAFNSESLEQTWRQTTVDVSSYTTSSFQVRFRYGSHAGFGCFPNRAGWYIDDVELETPCP